MTGDLDSRDLPHGWVETHLADVARSRNDRVDPTDAPEERFIGLEHVESETMRLMGHGRARDVRSSANRFCEGDVLYARLRPYLNKVIRAPFAGLCSAEFVVLEPTDAVAPQFLARRLNAADVVSFAMSFNTGVHRPRIRWEQLRRFTFGLPPRQEQDRIVEALGARMAELEGAVQDLHSAERALERFEASVLAAAITGRLTPSVESSRSGTELLNQILSERRSTWEQEQLAVLRAKGKAPSDNRWKSRYQAPAEPGSSAGVELPEDWSSATVDQLATLIQYGSSAKADRAAEGVPVLRMGNILDGRLQLDDLKYLPKDHGEFPDLLLKSGDVLFNRTNSPELVGKAAVFNGELDPCSFASYLIRVRLSPRYRPELLVYYLNSALGRAWVRSVVSQQVGQANVNGTKLKQLTLPVPPVEQQERICGIAEAQLGLVDEMRRAITDWRARSDQLRRATLEAAFRGQLVAQDPCDPAAAELLESTAAMS